MGGTDNGGSYALLIMPDQPEGTRGFGNIVAYIDAEDPNRSSWCRFVNHAEEACEGCNAEIRVDALRKLAWLELGRDVRAGEEICFHYGEGNEQSVAARRRKRGSSAAAAATTATTARRSPNKANGGLEGEDGDDAPPPQPKLGDFVWPDSDRSWCGL